MYARFRKKYKVEFGMEVEEKRVQKFNKHYNNIVVHEIKTILWYAKSAIRLKCSNNTINKYKFYYYS